MSWSLTIPQQPFETFHKAVSQAQLPEDTSNKPELVAQWSEQLEAAKAAVLAILSRDAFGHDEGATFSTSMSGHANHDGAGDGTGYTPSEFVHVNVQRQPAKSQ